MVPLVEFRVFVVFLVEEVRVSSCQALPEASWCFRFAGGPVMQAPQKVLDNRVCLHARTGWWLDLETDFCKPLTLSIKTKKSPRAFKALGLQTTSITYSDA